MLVGDLARQLPVGTDHECCPVGPDQTNQAIHDGRGRLRVHVPGGLVGKHEDRGMDQGPGHGHPLLLTRAELGGQVVDASTESQPFEHILHPLLSLGPGQSGVEEGGLYVLARGPGRE